MKIIDQIIKENKAGKAIAIPSVCSSHPDVIKASMMLAKKHDLPLLLEATSNQVNQFGGYTGMNAADFVLYVKKLCQAVDFKFENIILGGDHLGPQAWKKEAAEIAMEKAIVLVQDYVKAGFSKIHLDCSEGCLGEEAQVGDDIAAERAAILMQACEKVRGSDQEVRYIIGTEVPPPGGARKDDEDEFIPPTDPKHAQITIEKHVAAFNALKLDQAMDDVIGLVVQPGLEFAPDHIYPYDLSQPNHLSKVLEAYPNICFEAHSTDYQNAEVYKNIAMRNFAIHKVGPALTFAYRRALYALCDIRSVITDSKASKLASDMEALMMAAPNNWQAHYGGDETKLYHLRHYSYADRIRYYWDMDEAKSAVSQLFADLGVTKPFIGVIEQYFDDEVIDIAIELEQDGLSWPQALAYAEVHKALTPYFSVYKL